MKIYQGEPVGFKFNVKDYEGNYYPSLEGMSFEALLAFEGMKPVKKWKNNEGISIGIETVSGQPRGYASFIILGTETAELRPGEYTLEIASKFSSGRGIGKLRSCIIVEPALLKKGI